jgi:hypothetical protein
LEKKVEIDNPNKFIDDDIDDDDIVWVSK